MAAPQPLLFSTACSWSNELNSVERRRRVGARIWATIQPLPHLRHACSMGGGQCCGGTPGFDCLGLTNFFDELTLGSRAVTSFMQASTNDQRCDNIACGHVADMRVRLRWNWILVCASIYIRSILLHVMIKHLRPTLGEHRRWSQNGHNKSAIPIC